MTQNPVARFNQLYDLHKNGIYRYLRYLTRNTAESEDLFQETWLRVAQNMNKLDGIENQKSWIFTIATNLYRDALRKKRVRLNFIHNLVRDHGVGNHLSGSGQADPAGETERQQSVREVMQALGKLPEKMRQVFILREIEGFSFEEIGTALSLSTGTAKSRMHRAIKKVRQELGCLNPGSGVFSGDLA